MTQYEIKQKKKYNHIFNHIKFSIDIINFQKKKKSRLTILFIYMLTFFDCIVSLFVYSLTTKQISLCLKN